MSAAIGLALLEIAFLYGNIVDDSPYWLGLGPITERHITVQD